MSASRPSDPCCGQAAGRWAANAHGAMSLERATAAFRGVRGALCRATVEQQSAASKAGLTWRVVVYLTYTCLQTGPGNGEELTKRRGFEASGRVAQRLKRGVTTTGVIRTPLRCITGIEAPISHIIGAGVGRGVAGAGSARKPCHDTQLPPFACKAPFKRSNSRDEADNCITAQPPLVRWGLLSADPVEACAPPQVPWRANPNPNPFAFLP